jgi:hypothetical protein
MAANRSERLTTGLELIWSGRLDRPSRGEVGVWVRVRDDAGDRELATKGINELLPDRPVGDLARRLVVDGPEAAPEVRRNQLART